MTITGKGNFPFNSSWMNVTNSLYKQIHYGQNDSTLKTVILDWFFEPTGGTSYYGILKRYNAASWVKEPLKVYLGSWQTKPLKRWDGTQWREIDITGV